LPPLALGDPVPLPDEPPAPVGPYPIGILFDGADGTLQLFPGPMDKALFPLTTDSTHAFVRALAEHNLKVCNRVDGAPYDFGTPSYPPQLWLKLKGPPATSDPAHPDLTLRGLLTIHWSWGKECLIPTANRTDSGNSSLVIPVTIRYGRPGTIDSGSSSGTFAHGGGAWSASWGPQGISVAAHPGVAGQPAKSTFTIPSWGPSPDGYYRPQNLFLYVFWEWGTPAYPDDLGLSCADGYSFSASLPWPP